jgi:hypothetical protein
MRMRATAALGASVFALALGGVSEAHAVGPALPGITPQATTNQNSTDQDANARARSNQVNVNAPITVLSKGSGNGDVYQRNEAENNAIAKNHNDTDQTSSQRTSGGGSGWSNDGAHRGSGDCCRSGAGQGGPSHDGAANRNRTRQGAKAKARSKQVNVNAPLTAFTHKSGNGDVDQSNDGSNFAKAKNQNDTDQTSSLRKHGGSGCCAPDGWQELPTRGVEPLSSIGHQVGDTLQPGLAGGLLLLLTGLAFAAGRTRVRSTR